MCDVFFIRTMYLCSAANENFLFDCFEIHGHGRLVLVPPVMMSGATAGVSEAD